MVTHSNLVKVIYSWPLWIFGVVMCFMFPLLTAALSCLVYVNKEKFLSGFVLSPAFCIALSLSLLNSEKAAEGDLISYLEYFKELEDLSLVEVSLLYIREPVFYVLAWIFGQLFSFSDFTFKFCFSFVGYFPLLFALEKIMLDTGYNRKQIITGSLLVALSATVFANSLHLIRQFVSISFFMLALSSRDTAWRYSGFLLAFLTHVSTFFLIGFYFIAKAEKISKFLFLIGLVFYKQLITATVFLAIATNLTPLAYLAFRLSSESFHEMPGLSNAALAFLVVTLVFIFGLRVFKRTSRDQDGRRNAPLLLNQLYEINIFLGICVLIVQLALGLNEPAARLMFSYVVLTMFSLASALKFFRVDSALLGLAALILISNFGISLVYGTWTYNNLGQTLGCFLMCSNL